jgi:imidazolonepropionase-like amidohydrolase
VASRLVIENAAVIDGMGNPRSEGHTVVVEDERILEVRSSPLEVDDTSDSDLVRIDAAGKTLMPGLIDAHCHMTYGESMAQEEQDLYTSVEGRTLRAAWNVQKVLAAGVTGMSQPGGSHFIGVALRDAIRAGRITGPRMTTAGRYITTSNGLADFYPDSVGPVEGGIGIRCNTADEMITEVRRQVKNGVDFIKLADSMFGQYQSFRFEELKVVVDLAHQLHRPVTIHARGDAEMNAALRAGCDWVMHGNMMSDETIGLLADTQTPLVPTLVLLHNWAEYGPLVGAPTPIVEGSRRMLDRTRDSLHRAHAAGVRFALGTDSGFAVTPYGEWHAKELELLMAYAGLSELEAIEAATWNGGKVLNLEGKVGAIREGMIADLILVDGDPSANISVLQDRDRIDTVIVGGKVAGVDKTVESWRNEGVKLFAREPITRDLVNQRRSTNGGDPT